MQIADGATLAVNGTLSGGTIQSLGQGSLTGGRYSNLALSGQLAIKAGDTVTIGGTVANTGTLSLATTSAGAARLALASDTTLAGSGSTLLNADPSGYRSLITSGNTLTIAAEHTLRGAGDLGNFSYGALKVVNLGTLLADDGTLNLYSGSTAWDNRAGVLAASSDGVLNFGSALQLADASVLRIGVTGSSGHAQVGLLQLSGHAAFDGQVLLDLSGYSGAQVGDSFTFASYTGSYTGTFDLVSASGYTFTTRYADHQVTATITSVTAVPEPGSWAMLMAGLFGVGSIVRRRARLR